MSLNYEQDQALLHRARSEQLPVRLVSLFAFRYFVSPEISPSATATTPIHHLILNPALSMASKTAGAPGQTNVDAETFVPVEDLSNPANLSTNSLLPANGISISQGTTGDSSARDSVADVEENAAIPPTGTMDPKDDPVNNHGQVETADNVPPHWEVVQEGNDNHASNSLADNASMVDAALEFTSPTAIDKVLFPHSNAPFPNQPRFAISNTTFPVSYGMDGNHQAISYDDSPTPLTSAGFPHMDVGSLFARQSAFAYSAPQFYSPQAPVTTSNLLPLRTEMTPQALFSLQDALDRTSTPPSSKRGRVEVENEVKGQEAEYSSSIGKNMLSKRRKNNKNRTKAATVIGGVRYGGSATKMMTRRTHSIGTQVSAEERRRIRAERNRESAEKSRLRHKQRSEELERDVYHKRIENREMKASIDTYYAQLQGVADTIEKGTPREEAMKKVPALYKALASMQKAIKQCVWTYRDPREPEIPLKIPRN